MQVGISRVGYLAQESTDVATENQEFLREPIKKAPKQAPLDDDLRFFEDRLLGQRQQIGSSITQRRNINTFRRKLHPDRCAIRSNDLVSMDSSVKDKLTSFQCSGFGIFSFYEYWVRRDLEIGHPPLLRVFAARLQVQA